MPGAPSPGDADNAPGVSRKVRRPSPTEPVAASQTSPVPALPLGPCPVPHPAALTAVLAQGAGAPGPQAKTRPCGLCQRPGRNRPLPSLNPKARRPRGLAWPTQDLCPLLRHSSSLLPAPCAVGAPWMTWVSPSRRLMPRGPGPCLPITAHRLWPGGGSTVPAAGPRRDPEGTQRGLRAPQEAPQSPAHQSPTHPSSPPANTDGVRRPVPWWLPQKTA